MFDKASNMATNIRDCEMTKTLRTRWSSTAPQQRPVAKRRRRPAGKHANKDMAGEQKFVVRQTLRAAIRNGLIGAKDERITARLSHSLIEQTSARR